MKNFLKSPLIIFSLLFAVACGNPGQQSEPNNATNKNNPPSADSATADTVVIAYVCPMKCEGSAGNKPGKCNVCGMDLVENK